MTNFDTAQALIDARGEAVTEYILDAVQTLDSEGIGHFGSQGTGSGPVLNIPAKLSLSNSKARTAIRRIAVNGWGMDGSAFAAGSVSLQEQRDIARLGAHKVIEVQARLKGEATPTPAPAPSSTPAPPPAQSADSANARAERLARQLADMLLADNSAPLDESRVIDLIKEHATPAPRAVTVKLADDKPAIDVGLTHERFDLILTLLANGSHVYAWGPSGTGKTHIVSQLSKALGIPAYYTGTVFDPVQLFGFIDAAGNYHATEFRKAWEEGGLFLFDEMDASHPEALTALNMALSNGLCAFPDKTVKASPEFRCIGGGNTNGQGASRQYSTRAKVDAATLTRFVFVHFDYDEKLEAAISPNAKWCERVQAIRAAVKSERLDDILATPRATIEGAKLLSVGISQSEVEELTIWHGAPESARNRVEAAIKAAK